MSDAERVVQKILERSGYRDPREHRLYRELVDDAEGVLSQGRDVTFESLFSAGIPNKMLVDYEMGASRWTWLRKLPWIGGVWMRMFSRWTAAKIRRYRESIKRK